MKLQGLHHITMITGDAQRNVDFHAGLLGLRLVKKTVNFDQPDAYHLYYGDEQGSPGTLLTWFEFKGVEPGRAGAGMVHLIQLGVASEGALDFWVQRLRSAEAECARAAGCVSFHDPDGLAFQLMVTGGEDGAAVPAHPEIPPEHAILRVVGARAYAPAAVSAALLTETLGFGRDGDGYRIEGARRPFHWAYDQPPPPPGQQGAGTVHHIAWACEDDDDQAQWRRRVVEAGADVTAIIDRDYFHSIYFREPSQVLFEIATLAPGFAVDEDPAHLGENLRLPKQHEHLRERLEALLTPLTNPRTREPRTAS
jgi:glyoxalase family protein